MDKVGRFNSYPLKSIISLFLVSIVSFLSPINGFAEKLEESDTLLQGNGCLKGTGYGTLELDTNCVHYPESVRWAGNNYEYKFQPKQLILPGSLLIVGTVGVYSKAFKRLNESIKRGMANIRGTRYFHADDYLQYLPAVTYLTLGSIGVCSKHNFRERFVVEATAYIAMAAIVNIGKYTFREQRPESSARNSFPSGHTATVFTGAELMREEYGIGLGIASYTLATGIAFLRLYNGSHWLNDVIAGAGIGILAARIGYWMLPVYRKLFRWDKAIAKPTMFAMPSFDPLIHSANINVAVLF